MRGTQKNCVPRREELALTPPLIPPSPRPPPQLDQATQAAQRRVDETLEQRKEAEEKLQAQLSTLNRQYATLQHEHTQVHDLLQQVQHEKAAATQMLQARARARRHLRMV